MGVHIDAARDDIFSGCVDDSFGTTFGRHCWIRPRRHERDDGLAVDEHLGRVSPGGRDNRSALD